MSNFITKENLSRFGNYSYEAAFATAAHAAVITHEHHQLLAALLLAVVGFTLRYIASKIK